MHFLYLPHISRIVQIDLRLFYSSEVIQYLFSMTFSFSQSWLTKFLFFKKKQKLKNPETISDEVLEQRQLELEEKFPERKELDLDAPWQMDLLKLQRKVK